MSIFWIGGPEGIIVSSEDLKVTEEDRYFMPGVIHGGEDYIIQAWYWSNEEGPAGDRIGIKYLKSECILEWAKKATDEHGVLDGDVFEECVNEEVEDFTVENNGEGDFVSLNEAWCKGIEMSYQDIISWAQTIVKNIRGRL